MQIGFLEPKDLFSVWMGPIWYFIKVELRPVLCTVPFKEIVNFPNKRQPMILTVEFFLSKTVLILHNFFFLFLFVRFAHHVKTSFYFCVLFVMFLFFIFK